MDQLKRQAIELTAPAKALLLVLLLGILYLRLWRRKRKQKRAHDQIQQRTKRH